MVALEYSKRLDESKNNQLSNTASRSLMVGWLKETNVKLLENQLSNLVPQDQAARAHFNEGNESNGTYKSMLIDLPPSVLIFGLNGLINTLPTANKLWKIQRKMPDGSKIVSSHCMLRGNENATVGHVLCYCDFILNNGVFNCPKWRHDHFLSSLIPLLSDFELLCDLPGHPNHYQSLPFVNSTLRPDLLLLIDKRVIIGELTCPMESSITSRHCEKEQKYLHLASLYRSQGFLLDICAFEISARRLVADALFTYLKELNVPSKETKEIAKKLSTKVLKCFQRIFINRDNKPY
ncbi:hypothetical protein RCL1_007292 [Eukaryota sp. TZLM3-RCL]